MLLQTEYSVVVLSCFFLLIIVIPIFFYFWLKKSQKVDRSGIALENYRYISENLSKDLKYDELIPILASLPEFDSLSITQDSDALSALSSKLAKYLPDMTDLDDNSKAVIILLTAHIHREPLTPYLTTKLSEILPKVYILIEAFIEVGMQFNLLTGGSKVGLRSEMIWVDLMQALSQGEENNSYMMLPHLNSKILKEAKLPTGKQNIISNFKAESLQGKLDTCKLADIEEAARRISDLEMKVRVFVEGEEDIIEGDILTLELSITRKNLQPTQESSFIHSSTLPFLKYEKLYIFIGDPLSDSIYSIFKLPSQSAVQTSSIKFPISRAPYSLSAGSYSWQAILKSDSYLIPDLIVPISLNIKPLPTSKHSEEEEAENQDSECSEDIPELAD